MMIKLVIDWNKVDKIVNYRRRRSCQYLHNLYSYELAEKVKNDPDYRHPNLESIRKFFKYFEFHFFSVCFEGWRPWSPLNFSFLIFGKHLFIFNWILFWVADLLILVYKKVKRL